MTPRVRAHPHIATSPGSTALSGDDLTIADVTTTYSTSPIPTTNTGSNQAFSVTQPSLGIYFIIATQGVFPSRSRMLETEEENVDVEEPINQSHRRLGIDPFLGEIAMFAGNFPPRGWLTCDGQLLQISSNTALFSLLGTTFGGDGRVTFGLPDLRGRAPISVGTAPGLSPVTWGLKSGAETLVLSENQLPSHSHNTFAIESISGNATAT